MKAIHFHSCRLYSSKLLFHHDHHWCRHKDYNRYYKNNSVVLSLVKCKFSTYTDTISSSAGNDNTIPDEINDLINVSTRLFFNAYLLSSCFTFLIIYKLRLLAVSHNNRIAFSCIKT